MKSSLPDEYGAVPADVRCELDRVAARRGVIAQRIHWLPSTGSTNDVAAGLAADGAAEGTTVIAEAQTSGRGRHGRVWFSPPGAGVYTSVVLRPSSHGALVTLAAGVAVAEALRTATGLPAEIKWPNDVMIGQRKLAGILAEAAARGASLEYVVLGVGLNLENAAYPPDLAPLATSIQSETGRPAERALLIAEVLAALGERYDELRAGNFDAILSAWRRLAPSLPNTRVEWDSPRGVLRGCAIDIDSEGALLVDVGGSVERVVSGEIRLKRVRAE